jgi:hypothetical protein
MTHHLGLHIDPCPRCNLDGAQKLPGIEGSQHVICDQEYGGCGYRGPKRSDDARAIDAWNNEAREKQGDG